MMLEEIAKGYLKGADRQVHTASAGPCAVANAILGIAAKVEADLIILKTSGRRVFRILFWAASQGKSYKLRYARRSPSVRRHRANAEATLVRYSQIAGAIASGGLLPDRLPFVSLIDIH
jgi:hypothetical protein